MKKVLIGLVLSLFLVAAAFAGARVIDRNMAPTAQAAAAPIQPVTVSADALTQAEVLTSLQSAVSSVYDQVSPSVVYIKVTQKAQTYSMRTPWGQQQQQMPEQSGSGTGFVWDKAGHIVTNNHVVENADSVTVTFADGTTADARVVGTDANSDLAVISVDVDANVLVPVTMGDSTAVKVGQLAIAIGNPFGLQNTLTVGFVSAVGRSLPVNSSDQSYGNSGSSYTIPDVIQTDAAINPGNSGGVLLNAAGQVIGVTNSIVSSTDSSAGLGFAIPASTASKVVPELIKGGSYASSWLGISGGTLTSELAKAMDLPTDQRGVLVATVVSGGPADKAGLKAGTQSTSINGTDVQIGGDVITAIDGQNVSTFDALVTYLARSTTPGQKVTLTVLREGKSQQVTVTLGERPTTTSAVVPTSEQAS